MQAPFSISPGSHQKQSAMIAIPFPGLNNGDIASGAVAL